MPQVTSRAPDFTADAVVGGEFKPIKLSDYHGKWVLLFFWPLDFTFVCPTEIVAFSDAVRDFEKLNCQVLGVSVDSKFTHLAWTQTPRKKGGIGDVKFPVISDLSKAIAESYGVLLNNSIALRGLFLIDPTGLIRHSTINDLPVGRNVEEALRVLKAFQFVETHGEVCPANWKEGAATMKPTPKGSQAYFEKHG